MVTAPVATNNMALSPIIYLGFCSTTCLPRMGSALRSFYKIQKVIVRAPIVRLTIGNLTSAPFCFFLDCTHILPKESLKTLDKMPDGTPDFG